MWFGRCLENVPPPAKDMIAEIGRLSTHVNFLNGAHDRRNRGERLGSVVGEQLSLRARRQGDIEIVVGKSCWLLCRWASESRSCVAVIQHSYFSGNWHGQCTMECKPETRVSVCLFDSRWTKSFAHLRSSRHRRKALPESLCNVHRANDGQMVS